MLQKVANNLSSLNKIINGCLNKTAIFIFNNNRFVCPRLLVIFTTIKAFKMAATFQSLINGDKPVLVDFTATWCGPCKMMAPVLHELKTKVGETLSVIKVDIDQSPQAAAAYQVQSVPTFILFKNGKVLWRQSGAMPLAQLEQNLNTAGAFV